MAEQFRAIASLVGGQTADENQGCLPGRQTSWTGLAQKALDSGKTGFQDRDRRSSTPA
jgi:hypothetical protein